MSLKGFHVLFVSIATLCLVGFAVWTVVMDAGFGILMTGAVSGVLGVALAIYGSWFYRHKLKDSKF